MGGCTFNLYAFLLGYRSNKSNSYFDPCGFYFCKMKESEEHSVNIFLK